MMFNLVAMLKMEAGKHLILGAKLVRQMVSKELSQENAVREITNSMSVFLWTVHLGAKTCQG